MEKTLEQLIEKKVNERLNKMNLSKDEKKILKTLAMITALPMDHPVVNSLIDTITIKKNIKKR